MSQENAGNIFIVHGHDMELLQEVQSAVSSAGYRPIVLKDVVKSGSTQLFTALEENAKIADFAVILMTPDDGGFNRVNLNNLGWRARQNVIFEAGYFMSLLGTQKVVILLKGNTEIPSDLAGASRLECSDPNWQKMLIEEIKDADVGGLLTMKVSKPILVDYYSGGVSNPPRKLHLYHLNITNTAQRRHAENCQVVLKRFMRADTHELLLVNVDRLKWEGEINPEVRLRAKSSRNIAALCIEEGQVGQLFLYRTIDNQQMPWPVLNTVGEFILEYELYSDNFPPVRETFKLTFDGTHKKFILEPMST